MDEQERFWSPDAAGNWAWELYERCEESDSAAQWVTIADEVQSLIDQGEAFQTDELAEALTESLANACDCEDDRDKELELIERLGLVISQGEPFATAESGLLWAARACLFAEDSRDSELVTRIGTQLSALVRADECFATPEIVVYAADALEHRIQLETEMGAKIALVDQVEQLFRRIDGADDEQVAESLANACVAVTFNCDSHDVRQAMAERVEELYRSRPDYRTRVVVRDLAFAWFHCACAPSTLEQRTQAVAKLEELFWKEDACRTPVVAFELAKAAYNLSCHEEAPDAKVTAAKLLERILDCGAEFETPELCLEASLLWFEAAEADADNATDCADRARQVFERGAARFSMPALILMQGLFDQRLAEAGSPLVPTLQLVSERRFHGPESSEQLARVLSLIGDTADAGTLAEPLRVFRTELEASV